MAFELSALGFHSFFEQKWKERTDDGSVPGRIAAEHRGGYVVWCAEGEGPAQLSGRLRNALRDAARPAVGDWVAIDRPPSSDRAGMVQHVLERRTAFTRGAAGRDSREQVVAANVDVVFVVCGLDADFNVRRIERYLARVRASGADAVIVLSKADLVHDARARIDAVATHAPGVAVHAISSVRGEGVDVLRAHVGHGTTVALVGSSGAGKSTLVNALAGGATMATGPVRAHDGRGQHVTTHRQLVVLPGGGLLVDTPGMRELQLADEAGLTATFEEVAELARACRFGDCAHAGEPGCAVRAALETGALDPDRLAHFQELQREAQAHARRHDARQRRADERAFGRLADEARRRGRDKRGG